MKHLFSFLIILLFANCEQTDEDMQYKCFTMVYHYDIIDTRNGDVIKAGEVQTKKGKAYSEEEFLRYMPENRTLSDTTVLRGVIDSIESTTDLTLCP